MFRALLVATCLYMGAIYFPPELTRGIVYLALGKTLHCVSMWARVGSLILPGSLGGECKLVGESCQLGARRISQHLFKKSQMTPYTSWEQNKNRLAQIETITSEDQQLLHFLQEHWLAKQSGFHSFTVNWICPCFSVPIQVHPAMTSGYARDPASQMSQAYLQRMQKGKLDLPQPRSFPLLLTRSCDIRSYLPPFVEVLPEESIDDLLSRGKGQIFDVTERLAVWTPAAWSAFRQQLFRACRRHHIDPAQCICMQRVQNEGLTGLRILPLVADSSHAQNLLTVLSESGLSAARVELEGMPGPNIPRSLSLPMPLKPLPFVYPAVCNHPQKRLLIEASLHILNGFLDAISEDLWTFLASSPVRLSIIEGAVAKIREEFEKIAREENFSFFHTASRMEEIHAHLSSLLTICRPFTLEDFSPIYLSCMKQIPDSLQPLFSCGIHSGGMASFAGIVKAMEKMVGHKPLVLYGENTYFECINTVERVTDAYSTQDAVDEQWEKVDLIVAQFNPALKRPALYQPDLNTFHYRVEPVAEMIHRALSLRKQRPLTVALDCTFDFIDSQHIAQLLEEFQREIFSGVLNIVFHRSGLKFDLLGMDNYTGAPFAMAHQGKQWADFDHLLKDPALQVDPLSLQWFCLAYKYAAPELDLYRKQIFDNTRAILDRVPIGLYSPHARYRIVPMAREVNPGFIDFKISGLFHTLRAAAVGCGYLFSHCLDQGHPIFTRRSLGFYHPNFGILFGEKRSTIRLTIGIDPEQIDTFVQLFEQMNRLRD